MPAPLPTIERYSVESELGSGAFGAVYRARHLVLGRPVALKVLHPQRATDSSIMERFLREARAVAGLGSPHIVQVLDADVTSDGRAYIAMELLEGEDLATRLSRGRMSAHQVVRFAREVLAGLVVAHAQGVVHRDLKPANLFLARTANGEPSAKILDFGISKVRSESPQNELTRTGTMLGTPHYMAPEQFRSSRDVDGRADLYSLGVVLYEALAGKLPYQGETLHQLIASKLTVPPPALAVLAPDVPQALAAVVMRALAVEPELRFASAAEMDAALAEAETRVSAPGIALAATGLAFAATSVRPPPSIQSTAVMPIAPVAGRRWLPWLLGLGAVLSLGMMTVLVVGLVGAYFAQEELTRWWSPPAPAVSTAPAVAPMPTPRAASPVRVPRPAVRPAPPPSSIATPAPSSITTPEPSASPLPAPTSHVSGVHVIASVLGTIDASVAEDIAERARPRLAGCRDQSSRHENVQFVVSARGALQQSGMPAEGPAYGCIVAAFRSTGSAHTASPGIVRFEVTLDPL